MAGFSSGNTQRERKLTGEAARRGNAKRPLTEPPWMRGGSAVSIMLPPEPDGNNGPAPGWRSYDLTPEIIAPLVERFRCYYEPRGADECWIWGGPHFARTGYGKISRSSRHKTGQHILAHRMAWVLATGRALTDRLTVDHVCVNTLCVNPAHLEVVSLGDNIARRNTRRQVEREYPKLCPQEIEAARKRAAVRVAPLLRRRTRAAIEARLRKAA